MTLWLHPLTLNTLWPRQNGRHFTDDTFKRIFLNENIWILIEISLKFVHKGPINNIPALVQMMAWRRPGDKSLSEPMLVRLPTHICICVTRPQWVNIRRQKCLWTQLTKHIIRPYALGPNTQNIPYMVVSRDNVPPGTADLESRKRNI